MAVILTAIFKMAAKMRKISKCSNFNENCYVGFFFLHMRNVIVTKWFENGKLFTFNFVESN